MHFTTPLLAFLWLARHSNAAPQLRGFEPSPEGTSTTTRRVLRTAFVTVSMPVSGEIQSTPSTDVLTPAAGDLHQHPTLSSLPPQAPNQSGPIPVDSSTTPSQTPSPKPQSTRGPDTTLVMSALAQPASAPPPSIATSIAPQAAIPPPSTGAAAAALTTPPPQVPSFEEAYGDEFTQTTYWSCNTFALTTRCGWHEPILYIGGAKSGASRGRSLGSGSGGYGVLVLEGFVVAVVVLSGL